jgi:hypothetical protein
MASIGRLPLEVCVLLVCSSSVLGCKGQTESTPTAASGPETPDAEKQDRTPPRVVTTSPLNGTQDVDPALTKLSVTFNEPMQDGSWSWAYADKNQFPDMTGQPYYLDGNTKNILPVKLEPNKDYVIWLNTSRFQNFKNQRGVPSAPFKLAFRTRSSP